MKYIEKPEMGTFFIDYSAVLTDEFKTLVEKTKKLIRPFNTKECASYVWQFFIKNEWCCENDTCDNEDCVKQAIKDIHLNYGKHIQIEKARAAFDSGDNERINTCSVCEKPLNQFLCWNEIELDYLLDSKRNWCKKFFIEEAFIIMAILENCPSIDEAPTEYCKHQLSIGNKDPMQESLKGREQFYQGIATMCKRILCDFNERGRG